MPPDRVYYILFTTIHEVLKAEQTLKDRGVDMELVPVPRSLSSDCGVCLRSKASLETLAELFGTMAGARCFLFDGAEYAQVSMAEG